LRIDVLVGFFGGAGVPNWEVAGPTSAAVAASAACEEEGATGGGADGRRGGCSEVGVHELEGRGVDPQRLAPALEDVERVAEVHVGTM
jgi:hypothetical protein